MNGWVISAAEAAVGLVVAIGLMCAGLAAFLTGPLIADVVAGHAGWWRGVARRFRVRRRASRIRRGVPALPRDWSDTTGLVRVTVDG